jgi:hypothetical protein
MEGLINLEIGPVRALKALNPGLAHTIFFIKKRGWDSPLGLSEPSRG